MDSNDFIPCDLCEELFRFTDYEQHIQECMGRVSSHYVHASLISNNEDTDAVNQEGILPITNIVPFLFHIPIGIAPEYTEIDQDENEQTPIPAWVQQIAHLFDPNANANHHPLQVIENNMSEYELNTMLAEFMGGNVYVGVSDVSKVIHVVNDSEEVPKDDTLCAICQECLKGKLSENSPVVKTTCNHFFCRDCILQWLGQSKKCPVCLYELEK